MKLFFIIYLIVHLIICILIYLGVRLRVLKFSEQLLPIALFLPVFGVIICIIADIISRLHKTGDKAFSLEGMALDEHDSRTKHFEDDEAEEILPLEEALVINDAPTRRRLMLSVLRENPDEYVKLLQAARLDNDIEVTHYASTAIMEIKREHEISVQKAEKKYAQRPDDVETLDGVINALKTYIESGLVDANVLVIYQRRLLELLEERIKYEGVEIDVYVSAVDTALALENIGEATHLSDTMVDIWPSNEKSWIAKIRTAQQMNAGKAIKRIIAEIKARNIYLSPEGRNVVDFWDKR